MRRREMSRTSGLSGNLPLSNVSMRVKTAFTNGTVSSIELEEGNFRERRTRRSLRSGLMGPAGRTEGRSVTYKVSPPHQRS